MWKTYVYKPVKYRHVDVRTYACVDMNTHVLYMYVCMYVHECTSMHVGQCTVHAD